MNENEYFKKLGYVNYNDFYNKTKLKTNLLIDFIEILLNHKKQIRNELIYKRLK